MQAEAVVEVFESAMGVSLNNYLLAEDWLCVPTCSLTSLHV